MTGYSFSTPVWDGRHWVRPAVVEVAAAPKVNGPEDRPRERDAPAEWDKVDWREQEGEGTRARQGVVKGGPGEGRAKVKEPHKRMVRGRRHTHGYSLSSDREPY